MKIMVSGKEFTFSESTAKIADKLVSTFVSNTKKLSGTTNNPEIYLCVLATLYAKSSTLLQEIEPGTLNNLFGNSKT